MSRALYASLLRVAKALDRDGDALAILAEANYMGRFQHSLRAESTPSTISRAFHDMIHLHFAFILTFPSAPIHVHAQLPPCH